MLSVVGEDGMSLRESLNVLVKQKKPVPKELINPTKFPILVKKVWDWFIQLDSFRQNGMERQPLSEMEIGWFFRNRKIEVEVWQLDLIRKLDQVSFEKRK
jgi:hypothetical protein